LADSLAADEDLALQAPLHDELGSADELVGLDELDDIDLGGELADAGDLDGVELDLAASEGPLDLGEADDIDLGDVDADLALDGSFDPEATLEGDVETVAALHFSDGETAIAEGRWSDAVGHLESAYEQGVDVAELHALLAWGRFKASGDSAEMANHALELLSYAEEMSPNSAMIHGYRSAILLSLGDRAGAQDAAQRALDIDPYDELAIDVMDKLV
jgi:tetratricopeptide (TPR) repeat protein